MNKRKIAIAILVLTVALVVFFIFSNSLKTREESVKDSDAVVGMIGPLLERLFGDKIESISFVVRKLAHFTEFAVLGLATSALVLTIGMGRRWNLLGYGLTFCLVIAIADEIIQGFVGRGSAARDVLIDFCGAIFGFFVILLIAKMKMRKTKNK